MFWSCVTCIYKLPWGCLVISTKASQHARSLFQVKVINAQLEHSSKCFQEILVRQCPGNGEKMFLCNSTWLSFLCSPPTHLFLLETFLYLPLREYLPRGLQSSENHSIYLLHDIPCALKKHHWSCLACCVGGHISGTKGSVCGKMVSYMFPQIASRIGEGWYNWCWDQRCPDWPINPPRHSFPSKTEL